MKTRYMFGAVALVALLVAVGFLVVRVVSRQPRWMQTDGEAGISRKSRWQSVAIDIHSARNSSPEHVRARRARYDAFNWSRSELNPSEEVTVTAFATATGLIWVGPEQEFYIETDSGVLGGKMSWGDILWCESLIAPRSDRGNTNKALERFEKEIDGMTLFEASRRGHLTSARKPQKQSANTHLPGILLDFFRVDTAHPESAYKARVVESRGNTLCLRLEGPNPKCSTATVWIDINSKDVLKAIENGKHVFPI